MATAKTPIPIMADLTTTNVTAVIAVVVPTASKSLVRVRIILSSFFSRLRRPAVHKWT